MRVAKKDLLSVDALMSWQTPVVVAILVMAVVVLGLSVDGGRVTSHEAALFTFINGWPNVLYAPMTLFQYSGVLAAPAIVAAGAVYAKKYWLALGLVLIMPAKLIAEDVIKANFQRERPKVYIPSAILRGDVQSSGLSFVSGHALIITAIATVLTPFLPKQLRYVVWAVAGLCMVARVYLGAHLPRDVVGGALTGIAIGLVILYGYFTARKAMR